LERKFKPGDKVRHRTGNMYEVISYAHHSETKEEVVVYKSLADDLVWVRPKGMFEDGRFWICP